MIARGRLALHHNAQNSVNARLVAPAVTLEPIEYVRIETGEVPAVLRVDGLSGMRMPDPGQTSPA